MQLPTVYKNQRNMGAYRIHTNILLQTPSSLQRQHCQYKAVSGSLPSLTRRVQLRYKEFAGLSSSSSSSIMRLYFSVPCKQAQPLASYPSLGVKMEPLPTRPRKDKVVVVVGPTGTGKSRLSIDLAARFPAEVVNSDKMQIYEGLDIVTNKMTEGECEGVPHHLLGIHADPNVDFTATDFQHHASLAVDSIVRRDRLPIIAGGSNSFVKALVNDHIAFRARYECCFLWVDVSLPVLHSFLSERVDRMVEAGLVEEVRRLFNPKADYSVGIKRAIGVREMDPFLRAEASNSDRKILVRLLEAAIDEIKMNTCKLACRQLQNILRLQSQLGWYMHRLDATEALLRRGKESNEAWEKLVTGPSTLIVDQFLSDHDFLAAMAVPTHSSTARTIAATVTR